MCRKIPREIWCIRQCMRAQIVWIDGQESSKHSRKKLETCKKKYGCSRSFTDVVGVGDAKPSIFYFFEVLQMAWDHAH